MPATGRRRPRRSPRRGTCGGPRSYELWLRAGGSQLRRRGAFEEIFDGGDALVADVVAELVHVQRDVLAHHVAVHLERVLAHVADDLVLALAREAQAAADRVVDRARFVARDVAAHENRAERDRVARLVLPPVAQIDHFFQTRLLVGEPRLVDDQPGGNFFVRNRIDDRVEAHLHRLGLAPERQAQQCERRRRAARNRERRIAGEIGQQRRLRVDAGARDDERSAAAAERAARAQDAVFAEQRRDRAVADLRELELARARGAVERLDVVEHDVDRGRIVEQAVGERGEDVCIVGAGGVRERVALVHTERSTSRRASVVATAAAAPARKSQPFDSRSPTRLDTPRISIAGTPASCAARSTAKPSIDSTSARKRCASTNARAVVVVTTADVTPRPTITGISPPRNGRSSVSSASTERTSCSPPGKGNAEPSSSPTSA